MISIRSRLLLWLLPGFALVCVIAGLSIYLSTKHELNARMDLQLMKFADGISLESSAKSNRRKTGEGRPGLRQRLRDSKESGGMAGPISKLSIPESTEEIFYSLNAGLLNSERKSANLGEDSIPAPKELSEEAYFYDATLKGGESVRVMAQKRNMPGPMKLSIKMVVALNRKEADRKLSTVARHVLLGGTGCCTALALVLIAALHVALRPLKALGNKAAMMHAENLKERFSTNVPKDVLPIVERLNNLVARLEQSFERERRFSGDLAHELRTPLAAIRSTSEVAVKWPEQASTEDFDDIAKLATRLQQTLDSLLLLARMESKAADTVMEKAYLSDIAKECVKLYKTAAETRGIKFSLRLDSKLKIETDIRLMRMIISNLINKRCGIHPGGRNNRNIHQQKRSSLPVFQPGSGSVRE